MRRPKSAHQPQPARGTAIAPNINEAALAARLGSERMLDRTLNLYAKMAFRDGTDLTTAMIRARHGDAAAVRWAA